MTPRLTPLDHLLAALDHQIAVHANDIALLERAKAIVRDEQRKAAELRRPRLVKVSA